MKQLDLFGGEAEAFSDPPSRKTPSMQKMYGVTFGKRCRDCNHAYVNRYSKNYYRCELWDKFFRGHSEAGDIRLKNEACGKYVEAER